MIQTAAARPSVLTLSIPLPDTSGYRSWAICKRSLRQRPFHKSNFSSGASLYHRHIILYRKSFMAVMPYGSRPVRDIQSVTYLAGDWGDSR